MMRRILYQLPNNPGIKLQLTPFEMMLVRVDNFREQLSAEKSSETFVECVKYVAKTSGVSFESLKEKLRL